MNTNLPESSTPTIDSDLSIENWEDRDCRRLGYAGEVSHDLLKTDSSEPEIENRRKTADRIYMGRTVTLSEQWVDTDNNSDTDSVAELEYKTWDVHGNFAMCNNCLYQHEINPESTDRNDTRLCIGR